MSENGQNQEKGLMLLSELDILSSWDAAVTKQNAVELCQRSGALVSVAEQSEDYTFLVKAWSCWSFYETIIPGTGGRKKWQLTRIIDPKTGELPPAAEKWTEFCRRHLRMEPSTVSGYKSVWDTYVVKLEEELSKLSLAGKSKLLVAQKLIKDMWPGTNQELLSKLFDPGVSLAELTELVRKLRALMDGDDDPEEEDDMPKGTFEGDCRYNSDLKTLHWVGFFILGEERYPINEIVFDVLGEDIVGHGIPEDILLPFTEAIEEALG